MTDASIGNMIKRLYTGPDILPTNKKTTTNYASGGSVDPRPWTKISFYEKLNKLNKDME